MYSMHGFITWKGSMMDTWKAERKPIYWKVGCCTLVYISPRETSKSWFIQLIIFVGVLPLSSTFGFPFFLKLNLDLILSPCFCRKDLDFFTFLLSFSSPSLPLRMASSLLMLDTEYLFETPSLLPLTFSKGCAEWIEFCFSLSPPLLVDDVARLFELCVLSNSAKSCFTCTTTISSFTSGSGSGEGSGVWTAASRDRGLVSRGLGVSLVGLSSPKSGNWVLEWLSSREDTGETGAERDLLKLSLPSESKKKT